jgi:hypothetical protein
MNVMFGTDTLFDAGDFLKLVARLGLDLAFTTFLIVFVYYRLYRNREFVFTCYVFNIITYSICILLRKAPMDMGFALGLFAVFGILRYRTEPIRMRDLTYLFIVLGIAILNAVANKKVSLAELLLVNLLIVGITAVLELHPRARRYASIPMLYDNLPLLGPSRQAELLADLSLRTGFDVAKVQLHRLDLLRDAAEITVFYQTRSNPCARP